MTSHTLRNDLSDVNNWLIIGQLGRFVHINWAFPANARPLLVVEVVVTLVHTLHCMCHSCPGLNSLRFAGC